MCVRAYVCLSGPRTLLLCEAHGLKKTYYQLIQVNTFNLCYYSERFTNLMFSEHTS